MRNAHEQIINLTGKNSLQHYRCINQKIEITIRVISVECNITTFCNLKQKLLYSCQPRICFQNRGLQTVLGNCWKLDLLVSVKLYRLTHVLRIQYCWFTFQYSTSYRKVVCFCFGGWERRENPSQSFKVVVVSLLHSGQYFLLIVQVYVHETRFIKGTFQDFSSQTNLPYW